MVDQLTGSPASSGEAHAVNDVVQTGFQQAQEVVTLNASHLFRFDISVRELTFVNTVHVSDSLLFTQLRAVVAQLNPLCRSVLTRRNSLTQGVGRRQFRLKQQVTSALERIPVPTPVAQLCKLLLLNAR